MKTNHVIESWKAAEMKQVIGNAAINKEMMSEIQGGIRIGFIHSVSGDCNSSGESCWKILKDTINRAIDAVG
ncbi:MAG: hypothetical protein Q8914_04800 [Bacteroidota bacterium]|nr:hypothetical protein [Bacteroidota bacterium]